MSARRTGVPFLSSGGPIQLVLCRGALDELTLTAQDCIWIASDPLVTWRTKDGEVDAHTALMAWIDTPDPPETWDLEQVRDRLDELQRALDHRDLPRAVPLLAQCDRAVRAVERRSRSRRSSPPKVSSTTITTPTCRRTRPRSPRSMRRSRAPDDDAGGGEPPPLGRGARLAGRLLRDADAHATAAERFERAGDMARATAEARLAAGCRAAARWHMDPATIAADLGAS